MKKILFFMGLSLFGTVGSMSGQAAENKGLTLKDIAKIESVGSAKVSPDGQWVAYTKSNKRKPYIDNDGTAWSELYVKPIGGEAKPFITGKVNIGSVRWSKDSKTIYYIAMRNDDTFAGVYSIPVDGGESQKVVGTNNNILSYSLNSAGDKLVFIAKEGAPEHKEKLVQKGFQAKVYEEDIQNVKAWLYNLNDDEAKPESINIEGSVISAKFSPVSDQLLVQVSPTPLIDDIYMKKTLQVIDLDGDVVAKFKTEGKQGKAVWSTDGENIAFIGANDYNDPTAGALYIANVDDETVSKRVANDDSHVMDVEWHDDDLIYIEHKGLESRVVKAAVKRRIAAMPLVDYGNGIQRSLSVADNGSVYVLADTAKHPRELFAITGAGMQRLTNSNPWLDDVALAKQEAFEYEARDGLTIQGVLVYPLNYKKGKRYPMIAFIHGGPEAHRSNGWNTRYADPIQAVAAKGYFAFIPNYRGSTGRGDEFARLDQHAYADPEFTDILDGKLALVEKGMVDSDRVGITGGSYGGYATAWSATKLSEHYAAAVMFVGISNQLSKFGTTDIPNEMHAVHARAWPWDDFQWMLETSPIYHVKNAKTPLLIMHGDSDTRVHPSQSMELYRYVKTLGQAPVRLVLYPGEGHGNRKAAGQYDYSLRLVRWMDHYLKGDGGEPPAYDLKHEKTLEEINAEDKSEDKDD
ncbi:S9 family peptidase [Kangiella geojedonensis]|uniref:Peptidase S9 prolyl oligopeptidase active site domain protein n=1 Tax=Kangiella geojedonensis TaxID=914150 RepID=A0A0F6RCL2_9GAMM|nr:S9 family peptidase [Kangiella geojedonensis]AKE52141.1 Peptidase S9 prolyl oligopeptidase active site domain protein [Kangiella geojedonensis]